MKYVSKAPFRIGLAGGGTDVSPFSDNYGGNVLNATINLYATTILIPRNDGKIIINARNSSVKVELKSAKVLDSIEDLNLQIGVYNHIVKNFTKQALSFEIITTIDVPTGSGLGTSSTVLISVLGAFMEWLKLPLGEYDIAQIAVNIERHELNMAGGKQDQYAATFGGFNFMEFYEKNRVIVNPLRLKNSVIRDLNSHLLLFYTQTKRSSSKIIEVQKRNFKSHVGQVIEASKELKVQATKMKEALLLGELEKVGELLSIGWENKKKLAEGISSNQLERIYKVAISSGSIGGKISGAGGGGFMIFYCPNNTKFDVIDNLNKIGVTHQLYTFQNNGLETWTSQL